MPSGWLYILEPGDIPGSPTDQTARMDGSSGQKGSFTQTMLQRGNADIPLRVYAGDTYAPTVGCEVFLYDQIYGGGTILTFVGTIDRIELTWDGIAGDRLYHLTCVSLEQCFDVIRVPPGGFVGQTCGYIVTALFNQLMSGAPVTLGTISAGVVIPSISFQDWPRFSDIISQLATASAGQTVRLSVGGRDFALAVADANVMIPRNNLGPGIAAPNTQLGIRGT